MLQLTQNLKDGKMKILKVPFPALNKGYILIRNHYSVISSGTEGKTVKDARKGYIAKAKSRPKEVKQVLEMAKSQGLRQTYNTVMNKLDSPSALGYSCSGEVLAVGTEITDFRVGDYVACGGANAVHAEVVAVPKNLCVKVPKEVNLQHAAFTTVASIALQGVRQADLNLGENCVIIGLGLIGQLTAQLLNAGGVRTIGIDLDLRQVELVKKSNIDLALNRNIENIEEIIAEFTNSYGADAVIITAATSSLDPINLAGELCRKKGNVVVVGSVPTGFGREKYYKKELELRMSSSYGPGRYDTNYEEKGIDYPIGYVRWTENRNMQAFIDLLKRNKIKLDALITHTFSFEDAPKAYDMILNKTEPFAGILLKYDVSKELKNDVILEKSKNKVSNKPNVGFIGAGSFAQNLLLPNLKEIVNFESVATSRSNSSRNIADKYNFSSSLSSGEEVINNPNIDTVFIATRHNLHADYVIKSLESNKNVFTEKPLCMNEKELEKIRSIYYSKNVHLMIGFNRRFAPLLKKLRTKINYQLPLAINYRINAGTILKDHWVQDSQVGGGRIIGEVCHFIDLCYYLSNSKIFSVSSDIMETKANLWDTLSINLKFENGSVASISYFSNGNKQLEKEHLEVFNGGTVYILNDFKELVIYGKKKETFKIKKQDKGHKKELEQFINSLSTNKPLIPFEELYHSTFVTFNVIESIKNRKTIHI